MNKQIKWKKDIILSLAGIYFPISSIYGQIVSIDIKFYVEGKIITIDNESSLSIISKKDTVVFPIRDESILIPDSCKKVNQHLAFDLNRYKLEYEGIPLNFNPNNLKWTISLDSKPFMESTETKIKTAKKRVKSIYTFHNGTQFQYQGYRYKKVKPKK